MLHHFSCKPVHIYVFFGTFCTFTSMLAMMQRVESCSCAWWNNEDQMRTLSGMTNTWSWYGFHHNHSWSEVLYVVSGLQCIHGTSVFPTRFLHFHICFTGSNRCGCVGLAFPNADYVINFSFRYTAKDYERLCCSIKSCWQNCKEGIVHTFFTPAYQVGHSSCTRLGCRRLNVKEWM